MMVTKEQNKPKPTAPNKSPQSKGGLKSNPDSYQKIISSRGSGRHNKYGDSKIYDLTYVYLPVETVRVCASNKGFNVKIMVIPGRTSLLKCFSEMNHFSTKHRPPRKKSGEFFVGNFFVRKVLFVLAIHISFQRYKFKI